MTGVMDVAVFVAWISGIVYVTRQTTRKPPSAARTGSRGRRQRARSGNGGMSERFTPPPRYGPDVDARPKALPDHLATALATLTPALLCTLCVIELKQARAAGHAEQEIYPGVVMGETIIDGRASTAVLCEVRHELTVGTAPRPTPMAPALRTLGLGSGGLT